VISIVEDILNEYPFEFSSTEFEQITQQVDASDVIYQNQKSWERGSYDERESHTLDSGANAIDELFSVDFPRES